jgi:hypothetical protein
MQTHQPQSATEAALVETMAVARWRLLRVWGAQGSQDNDPFLHC